MDAQKLAVTKAIALTWRKKANLNKQVPVDLFMWSGSFVRCAGTDSASLDAAWAAFRKSTSPKFPGSVKLRARRTSTKFTDMSHVLLLRDGSVILDALCLEKPDVGNHGVISQ
eukprot:gene33811-43599_t